MRKVISFKNFILKKEDNKGSIMVTALVAFLFVSILAAVILSTVTVNFNMRAVDRRTKDEFYYAEKALNDLYNGLGQECSMIMGESYNDVLAKYRTTDDATVTYKDEEKAYKAFAEQFVKTFYTRIAKDADTQRDKFSGYIVKDTHKKGSSDADSRAIVKKYGDIKYYNNSSRSEEVNISSESDVDNIRKVGLIVVKGVRIQSNPDANENIGYVSEINTDIVIEVPRISFFTMNNRVFDYAILANDGLEIEENAQVIAKGNVYAGTEPFANITENVNDGSKTYDRTADYGGIVLNNNASLKVDDAAYVVSGGDITLDNATLNINQDNAMLNNQIWFENIEINGASTVNIKGDLFAADDLQVNSNADGSNVKIEGSYYGYNDGERSMIGQKGGRSKETPIALTTKKAIITSTNDYEKSSDMGDNTASRSSSIVINANNTTIDMSDLKTLLLCGNAFVNHESKKSIVPGKAIRNERTSAGKTENLELKVDVDTNSKISSASVPESVALKMSQDIILMPTEFLKDANPRPCDSGTSDPFASDGISIPSDWFGKAYIDNTKPYTYVKLDADSTMIYAYCYLNFKDDKSKAQYVDAIVNADLDAEDSSAEPTAKTLKRELIDRTGSYKDSLTVKVGNGDTRVYANGAVLKYEGSDMSVISPSDYVDSNAFTQYSANLYKRYRMLDTYLDNMSDVPLSATDTKGIENRDFQETDEELPMGRFFWLWGIRKAAHAQEYIGHTGDSNTHAVKYVIPEKTESSCTEQECMDAEKKEFGSNFIFLKNSGEVDLCSELIGANPHKAFVIIDGNAVVKEDLTIHGFLVCKGKITVKDGKKLTVVYDSTLLNKRIEKEQQKLIENNGYNDDNAPNNNQEMRNLLIYYLMNGGRSYYGSGGLYSIPKETNDLKHTDMKANPSYREYQYIDGVTTSASNELNSDYTNFVYYENWKKGQQKD